MKIFKIFCITIFFFSGNVFGQERLTGIQINEKVAKVAAGIAIRKTKKTYSDGRQTHKEVKQLPFFDDFTTSKIVPDTTLWIDHSVFINNDFSYFPPNLNVATFDALDSTGKIYANADYIAFPADVLTSVPLRTDSVFSPIIQKLSPSDSLYLSFYYQPQGRGNAPEEWDTLILEMSYLTGDTVFSHIDSIWVSASIYLKNEQDTIFPFDTLWATPGCSPNMYIINYKTLVWGDLVRMPCDSVMVPERKWKEVWKANGMKLSDFQKKYGKNFVRVMIPITDTDFFFKSFQFRFRNYASIANDINPSEKSNCDEWNVDFVYLNYNRSIGDTTYRMLTFSARAPSFLKHYQVMPYRQYRADPTNSLRETFHMYIANLDKIEHNTKYRYEVYGTDGTFYYDHNGGSCNLPPFYTFGFQNCNTSCGRAHACPTVDYAFNIDYSVDTASFVIKHYISDSSQGNFLVDSAIYRQGFYNYFAYDDGTPEFGYFLEPTGAQLAYQFKLTMADTLQGVQIYFSQLQDANDSKYFDLKVWGDNNGKPGELLYSEDNKRVKWENGIYRFYPYLFEYPFVVSGTIYVGYEQQEGGINVGFDVNDNEKKHIFYNVENTWYQSNFDGALLIRPIVGSRLVLGEKTFGNSSNHHLKLYPNPADNYLKFDASVLVTGKPAEMKIYSVFGQLILQKLLNNNTIDIAFLREGMYMLTLTTDGKLYTTKFLKRSR